MQEPIDPGFEKAVEALVNAGFSDEQAREQLRGIQTNQAKIRGDLMALRGAKEGESVRTHDGKFWVVRWVNGEPMLEPDTRTGKQRRLDNKPKRKRFR